MLRLLLFSVLCCSTVLSLKCVYGVKWNLFDIQKTCDGQVCVSGTGRYQDIEGRFWGCLTKSKAQNNQSGCGGINRCNFLSEGSFKGYTIKEVFGCCCDTSEECNREIRNRKNETETDKKPMGFFAEFKETTGQFFKGIYLSAVQIFAKITN